MTLMIRIGLISLDSFAHDFISAIFIVKFYVWLPNMPYALDKSNNGRFKREHVESSSITNHIHPLPQYIWPPNFAVWWSSNHMVFWDHITRQNHYIPNTTVPRTTKLLRIVLYLDGFLAIKLHEDMFLRFSKIMWETKTNNLYRQCLWQPNLARWWLILSASYLTSQIAFKACGLARSYDKLSVYLH